jgi:hypothetical protein
MNKEIKPLKRWISTKLNTDKAVVSLFRPKNTSLGTIQRKEDHFINVAFDNLIHLHWLKDIQNCWIGRFTEVYDYINTCLFNSWSEISPGERI